MRDLKGDSSSALLNCKLQIANCKSPKPLDDDCLLDGQLHPSIALRLQRVRELPVPAVANLHGVERDDTGRPVLVWEYVDGRTLEEAARAGCAGGEMSDAQRAAVRRDVMLAIEALHAAGITHGAIHERNVILDGCGRVKLTHVSPLLWDDPSVDRSEADAMFERLGFDPAPPEAPLPPEPVRQPDPVRAGALIGAAVAAALGLMIAISVVWYASLD
jgi:serine/threonine-protein kinase